MAVFYVRMLLSTLFYVWVHYEQLLKEGKLDYLLSPEILMLYYFILLQFRNRKKLSSEIFKIFLPLSFRESLHHF